MKVLSLTKAIVRHYLTRSFGGDEIILYAVSCMWDLRITIFNSQTGQEYRVRHSVVMDQADVNLVLNGGTHYSAVGKWSPGRL